MFPCCHPSRQRGSSGPGLDSNSPVRHTDKGRRRKERGGLLLFVRGIVTAVVALMVLSVSGTPVQAAGGALSSPMLGEILGKTEAHYQQLQAFTADFRQTTTSAAAGGMVLAEAKGRLYYQKTRQMRWEYDEPEKQIFVANQRLAWLQVPAERQITLFDAKTIFSSPFVRTFFDGVVELRKHFEVNLDSRMSNKDSAVLRLSPLVEDPNIKALLLWIDLNTYQISAIESHDALGNANRIVLESQKTVPRLDSGLFRLDVPQGTTVLDAEGRELKGPDIEKLKEKLKP